jgi:DNA-binding NarL/FixJ family response regulator
MQEAAGYQPLRPHGASAPARARIVLIDSHAILRAGIRVLLDLESDLQVVGEASVASDGLRAAQETAATLLITDLALESGPSELDALRAAAPNLRVLVLTACCTDGHLRAALSAGVDGYVLKEATTAELLLAIRTVIAGQRYFSSQVSTRLLSGYLGGAQAAPARLPSQLTAREREVLVRIALGESNKGAALAMQLSVKTVEKHRANLMRKLELRNTAAMTLFAVRNGLLPSAPAGGNPVRRTQAREAYAGRDGLLEATG